MRAAIAEGVLPPAHGALPPAAYATALACLPGVGPGWLVAVLSQYAPASAWKAVVAGRIGPPARAGVRNGRLWAEAVARFDLTGQWERCLRSGIRVCWPGSPGYPSALRDGPAPPGVLFLAGSAEHIHQVLEQRPRVAVVGTRRCTPEGSDIAYRLGYDLGRAGVCVVSGLALGIDGAAHAGALAANRDGCADEPRAPGPEPLGPEPRGPEPLVPEPLGPEPRGGTLGVAASGVDVVYPRAHAALWREVARTGAVLSETPPGHPAQAWRFPSRNRLIAGLAEMVVVVECHASGGSWHTVDAALKRGVDIGAVPGSVLSPASVGTNCLLHEGATPIRGAEDVLDALAVGDRSAPRAPASHRPLPRPGRPAGADHARGDAAGLGPVEQAVLAAISRRPRCLDEVVEGSGLPVAAVVVGLERLEQRDLVSGEGGWWVRRPR